MMLPSSMLTTTLRASLVTCLVLTLTFKGADGISGFEAGGYWLKFLWNRFPSEALPLYLTPYVEAGKIEEAQKRSRVRGLGHDDVESYAGYFTVDERYNSNMFFWFFPAPHSPSAPVLLWLNGGPGRSSMVGAMLENGPLELFLNTTYSQGSSGAQGTEQKKIQIRRRAISWTESFSMIYIDNPVDVGYSYTANIRGLSRNMEDVSRNLYSVLTQFFKLFPQYSTNDFYVGGQSYAGKYVPSLGCYIHNQNHGKQPPDVHINFKGIYLGAGFCDPEKMMPAFADFMFNMGFISDFHRRTLKKRVTQLIQEGLSGKILLTPTEYLASFFGDIGRSSRLSTLDHVMGRKATVSFSSLASLEDWMYRSHVRHALHVGYAQTADSDASRLSRVRDALHHEFLWNTSKENAFLMDNYKVLHYSGNLDLVVSVPMTEAFLASVPWSGQAIYNEGTNIPWSLAQVYAVGYFQKINNFTRVILRNCGHMAPSDQPEYTLAMMKRFIFDMPFEQQPFWSLYASQAKRLDSR